jgi:cytochrome bd-type quinol oxidase subunit 2
MPISSWSDRLARTFAILRGAMVVLFSVWLIIAPEKAMPGSSTEPARSLALIFASRTILLGIVFVVLAIRRRREGLAWVFFADAALQLFDTGMAFATHKGALAVLPAVLGAIDMWAGLFLLRAARVSPSSPSH